MKRCLFVDDSSVIRKAANAFLVEMDVAAIMRAKPARGQNYILKPFNRAQLVEKFRTMNSSEALARIQLRA